VSGRRVSWLVAVALAWTGSVATHSLGLLHGAGEGAERLGVLAEAAHATVGQVPLPVGLLAAVALTWLAGWVLSAVRRRPARPLAPGWLLAVPLLGWALQEAAERLLGVESFPFAAAREPAFLKGLVVQVLFGVLAVLVARLLLARIRQLRQLGLPDGWPRPASDVAGVAPAWRVAPRPRQLALARGYDERGPPPTHR
jgi:hypothetical protein